MVPPKRKVPRALPNTGVREPTSHSRTSSKLSALDGRDHVALGHEVAGEFLDRKRHLVVIAFLPEEPDPVLSALVVREGLFVAGRAGVTREVIFSVPPFVLWFPFISPKNPLS